MVERDQDVRGKRLIRTFEQIDKANEKLQIVERVITPALTHLPVLAAIIVSFPCIVQLRQSIGTFNQYRRLACFRLKSVCKSRDYLKFKP